MNHRLFCLPARQALRNDSSLRKTQHIVPLQSVFARRHVRESPDYKVRRPPCSGAPARACVSCCSCRLCAVAAGAACHAAAPAVRAAACRRHRCCRRRRRRHRRCHCPQQPRCAGCALNPWRRSGRVLEDTFFKKAKVRSRQPGWPSHARRDRRARLLTTVLPAATRSIPIPSVLCRLQAQGYVARSAYKLQEIQEKHKLIKPGSQVLDLGCHPGAWLQVRRAGCREGGQCFWH